MLAARLAHGDDGVREPRHRGNAPTGHVVTAGRVAMHAVRERLLEAQAERVGLPLWKIPLPSPAATGITSAGWPRRWAGPGPRESRPWRFGDLFLEDVRRFREEKLAPTGVRPVFPLRGLATSRLAREMVDAGVRAVITCVDPKQLHHSFAGRTFDESFLRDLPETVDPCGENGEFHTFVYDGPLFDAPLEIARGDVVERDSFVFADVDASGRETR